MFSILPLTEDFCRDDAEFFTDLEAAYDAAFEWSVELNGDAVGIFESRGGKYIPVTTVFA